MANYIKEFLAENNVLTEFQHGFRKGYSTVTQLVSVIHSFALSLDNNGQIDVIFLDFRKAFDKVPHDKLIFKLRIIGIPDIFINWIIAYLSKRTQYVTIGEHSSATLPVTSGCPKVVSWGLYCF